MDLCKEWVGNSIQVVNDFKAKTNTEKAELSNWYLYCLLTGDSSCSLKSMYIDLLYDAHSSGPDNWKFVPRLMKVSVNRVNYTMKRLFRNKRKEVVVSKLI